MIYYATQETMDRYKLKRPHEMSPGIKELCEQIIEKKQGNSLYEWGVKLFYFDRRKCLQILQFLTRITVFLIDCKVNEIENAANAVVQYLFYLSEFRNNKSNISKQRVRVKESEKSDSFYYG